MLVLDETVAKGTFEYMCVGATKLVMCVCAWFDEGMLFVMPVCMLEEIVSATCVCCMWFDDEATGKGMCMCRCGEAFRELHVCCRYGV